jgi:chromosome segregation ATPase
MPTIYDIQRDEVYTADPRSSSTFDTHGSAETTVGYMSAITPRQVIITRPVKNLGGGNRNVTSKMSISQSMSSNAGSLRGGGGGGGSWALVPFNSQRTEEKRQLAELNDRFAEYIGKIRYLEAVNRKLSRDLDNIRNKKGIGMQRIREIITREKKEAEDTLKRMDDDIRSGQGKRQEAEARLKQAEGRLANIQRPDQINGAKGQLKQLREKIIDLEKKIELIRKTIADNDDEITLYNAELQRIRSDIANLISEIANEATQKQLLMAEKTVLEQELKALDTAHKFDVEQLRSKVAIANVDPAPFFESELTSAIREIRKQFETITDQQQQQLQNYYQAKVSALIEYHQPKQPVESQWQTEKIREITRSISDVRGRVNGLQMENQDLDRQIAEIRQQIQSTSYQEDQRLINEQKRYREEIDRLKGYISDLEKYRTTLEEEIRRYRLLLEGGTNQVGLRHFAEEAEKIMNRGRSLLDSLNLRLTKNGSGGPSSSHNVREVTYSTSYSSGGGIGGGRSPTASRAVSPHR